MLYKYKVIHNDGGGNVIHAPQPGDKVKITKLSELNKYMTYITSRTLFWMSLYII